jgi:hypothetical protein
LLSFSEKVRVGFIKTGECWVAGNSEVPCSSRIRRISMSVYLVKGRTWRYDFVLNGIRYTEGGFKTKREAKQAEATRREEIKNPAQ